MRPRSIGGLSLIFTIAGILLYFSLRGINWPLVAETIRSISPAYASLSIAMGLIPMFLRAVRWRILLQAQGPVSLKTTFWAVCAGYFGNNFLPARGGELVRSFIIKTYSELGLSYALATALSERVADAVALVLLGAVALIFTPELQVWMKMVRGSFAGIGVAGILGLVLLPKFEMPLNRLLTDWPRLSGIGQQMLLGIRSFHDGLRILQFTVLTSAIWLADAAATSILAHSLGISMPISVAMLLIVALSLSSALPSTPGYIGVYQFVAVMVLKPFGISSSIAMAFMLVTQAISYVITGGLGLLAMTYFTPFSWRFFRRPLQAIHIEN